MKKTLLLLVLTAVYLTAYSQKDYYVSDSIYDSGFRIINQRGNKNFRQCAVIKSNLVTYFSPFDISEYGLKNGDKYFSKEIQTPDSLKKVFMQQLVEGEMTLYYYLDETNQSFFFVEKRDRLLHELSKDDLKNELWQLTEDCSKVKEAVYHVDYDILPLTQFVKRYNMCSQKPFPFFKYGVYLGTEIVFLDPSSLSGYDHSYLKQLDFKSNAGFTVGAFIDYPILLSDFSLKIELTYSQHNYNNHKRVKNTYVDNSTYKNIILNYEQDIDFISNVHSLKIPLLIKYTFQSVKTRPYVNAGGVFAYNFINNSSIYTTVFNKEYLDPDGKFGQNPSILVSNVIEISKPINERVFSNNEFGYVLGAGIDIKLNYKTYLFIECRFSQMFAPGMNSMTDNNLYVISGINF